VSLDGAEGPVAQPYWKCRSGELVRQDGCVPSDHQVQALVRKVIEDQDFEGGTELLAQVPHLRVAHGPITMLHLNIEQTAVAASSFSGDVVPGRAWVRNVLGEPIGTLLVWVSGGYITDLEYAWMTDEPPSELPTPDQVTTE
jgi:hypothetical protein